MKGSELEESSKHRRIQCASAFVPRSPHVALIAFHFSFGEHALSNEPAFDP